MNSMQQVLLPESGRPRGNTNTQRGMDGKAGMHRRIRMDGVGQAAFTSIHPSLHGLQFIDFSFYPRRALPEINCPTLPATATPPFFLL
jgi:hypothetical protein